MKVASLSGHYPRGDLRHCSIFPRCVPDSTSRGSRFPKPRVSKTRGNSRFPALRFAKTSFGIFCGGDAREVRARLCLVFRNSPAHPRLAHFSAHVDRPRRVTPPSSQFFEGPCVTRSSLRHFTALASFHHPAAFGLYTCGNVLLL